MREDPIKITALTLIDKVIDFVTLTPDPNHWNFESQQKNEPRFVRMEQLESLIQLFLPGTFRKNDMKQNIESLINGQFIFEKKTDYYKNVFNKMEQLIQSRISGKSEDHIWHLDELQFNYERMFEFKRNIENLKKFNDEIMEISYPNFYSYYATKSIIESIKNEIIDDFLTSVIDPLKKVYDKEYLIKHHNYPNMDLFDIDIEWM